MKISCSSISPFLVALMLACGQVSANDPKSDAAQRVANAHDPLLFVATGSLYLKQEALRARGVNALPDTVEHAVENFLDATVRNPAWVTKAIKESVERELTAAEADEIAAHFATEGGALQRNRLEMTLGEVLMMNYTFSGRIDHRLPGLGRELKDLQRVANERGVMSTEDYSAYPDNYKFATSGTGKKYVKLLMIQGVAAMTAHLEQLAAQTRTVALAGEDATR